MEPSHQTSQTRKDNKWQNVRKKNLFQMERNALAVKSQDISTSNQDSAKCVKMATLSQDNPGSAREIPLLVETFSIVTWLMQKTL